jgi:GT2 family glycosyltransferase
MRPRPAEVVLVDAESNDETIAIVRDCFDGSGIGLKVIKRPCKIAEGRNAGVTEAAHEAVLISDAGTHLPERWAADLFDALTRADVAAGYYSLAGNNWVQRSYRRLFERLPSSIRSQSFLPSSRSMGIRRSVFVGTGGYRVDLTLAEDTEYMMRLRSLGYKFEFVPSARAEWVTRPTLKLLYRQHFGYARWDAIAEIQYGLHLKQLAYSVAIACCIAIGTLYPIWLLAALVGIGGKPTVNVLRRRVAPCPSDVLVYNVVIAASCAGFAVGLVTRLRALISGHK